jgi:hypothetical protein
MNFRTVPFHFVESEIKEILPEHYECASENDNYEPLNVDWDYYRLASQMGTCFCILALDKQGIAGYSIFFIDKDAHSKDIVEACNSAVFVKKEKRGRLSFALFQEAENVMKSLGAHKISYPVKNEKFGKFLKRHGYKQDCIIWSKENE